MMVLHRGEIWWAQIPEPVGRRPVLLLTRDRAVAKLTNVTCAPLTRTARGIETEVALGTEHGLPSDCAVTLDNIQTSPKSVLDRRIAKLDADTLNAIAEAIHVALDLPF